VPTQDICQSRLRKVDHDATWTFELVYGERWRLRAANVNVGGARLLGERHCTHPFLLSARDAELVATITTAAIQALGFMVMSTPASTRIDGWRHVHWGLDAFRLR
jgi:hypothetical protein